MIINEKLNSKLELMPEFVSKVINEIRPLTFSEEEIYNIRLSLEEALINAMKHGNKLNPDLSVEVKIDIRQDCIIFEVIDQGQGFDFRNLPEPHKGDNLLKTSGRGIFLIRNLMDKVDFFSSGRIIRMTKFVDTRRR